MEGMELGAKSAEYLFTQGVLGVAVALLIGLCIYLERKNSKTETRCRLTVEALEEKHETELASAWKYSRELQEKRAIALEAALDSSRQAVAYTDIFLKRNRGDTQ